MGHVCKIWFVNQDINSKGEQTWLVMREELSSVKDITEYTFFYWSPEQGQNCPSKIVPKIKRD